MPPFRFPVIAVVTFQFKIRHFLQIVVQITVYRRIKLGRQPVEMVFSLLQDFICQIDRENFVAGTEIRRLHDFAFAVMHGADIRGGHHVE